MLGKEQHVNNAFKDEMCRLQEIIHVKENRVKQLEQECSNLRDDNHRLDTIMIRKEE